MELLSLSQYQTSLKAKSRQMSKLYQLIQKGNRYFQEQRYEQSIQIILSCLNKFPEQNNLANTIDKITGTRIIAQAFEKLHKIQKAKQYIQKAHDIIHSQKLKISSEDQHNQQLFYSQIHMVHTTYGLLLFNQSDALDKKTQPKQKFQSIQNIRAKFISAHKITKSRLMAYRNRIGKMDKTWLKDWLREYTNDLVNLLNIYAEEGDTFEDQRSFHHGLAIIKKLQKFYEVHKGELKSYQNLYKSYYYKGAFLRRLGKYEEAKHFLLQDQKYCSDNNLKQLLKTNRIQLFSLYILIGDYQNAHKKASAEQKSTIKYLASLQKDIKRMISESRKETQFSFEFFQKIADKIFQLSENRPFYNQLVNMSHGVLVKYGKSLTKKEIFKINYFMIQCYYKMKRYSDGKEIVDKILADNLSQEEQLQIRILGNQIYNSLNPKQIKMIQENYSQSIRLARKLNDEECVKLLQQNSTEAKIRYQRLSVELPELSDDEQYTIEPYVEYKQQKKELTKRINLSNPSQIVAKQQTNQYNKLCLEQHIQMNKNLREQMKVKKSDVLKQFINIQPQHLLIVLESIKNLRSLDLQNHETDSEFWQGLIALIQDKKINIEKLQQLCIYPYVENQKLMYKFLQMSQNLKRLKIQQVMVKMIPQTNYEKIQVLALNSVNLDDISISNIPFHTMNQLKDLVLKNNKLTGRCFSHLNRIFRRLNKINLSKNPLSQAIKDQLNVASQKLVLKDIIFSEELLNKLDNSLYNTQSLSLSRSAGISHFIKLVNDRYQDQRLKLIIKQLKMNEIQFPQQLFLRLDQFFIIYKKSLKVIRMKFIQKRSSLISGLLQSINQNYLSETILDLRGSVFNPLQEYRITVLC